MRPAAAVALACLLALLLSPLQAAAAERPDPPAVNARAAILIDLATGQELYARDADRPLPMASLTKVMTALLVLEHSRLDELAWVPYEVRSIPDGKIWLEPGTRVPVEDLLEALLLASANDAALTLAFHVSGSEEAFVELMNRRAQELGLTGTQFRNPHGLHEAGHQATARDLARLTRAAMANPTFRRLVALREAEIADPAGGGTRPVTNINALLAVEPRATGVKTGYTSQAQSCLIGSAAGDGVELIGVILGADTKDQVVDAMAGLLDWGLTSFRPARVLEAGQRVALPDGRSALVERDVSVLVPVDGAAAVEVSVEGGAGEAATPEAVVRVDGREAVRVPLQVSAAQEAAAVRGQARRSLPLAAGLGGLGLLLALRRLRLRIRRRSRRFRLPRRPRWDAAD